MRGIKFRAWIIPVEAWTHEVIVIPNGIVYAQWFGTRYYNTNIHEDTLIVEQYTGLNDKNGREIFEGDIISQPSYRCDYQKIGQVVFNKSTFSLFLDGYFVRNQCIDIQCEVIGNIHENPELLS
jgi:uncharacterized phage protein (TIGR01671 family)